ncbi:hypothetical protein CSUI_010719, partial [Cystoisospora suis]
LRASLSLHSSSLPLAHHPLSSSSSPPSSLFSQKRKLSLGFSSFSLSSSSSSISSSLLSFLSSSSSSSLSSPSQTPSTPTVFSSASSSFSLSLPRPSSLLLLSPSSSSSSFCVSSLFSLASQISLQSRSRLFLSLSPFLQISHLLQTKKRTRRRGRGKDLFQGTASKRTLPLFSSAQTSSQDIYKEEKNNREGEREEEEREEGEREEEEREEDARFDEEWKEGREDGEERRKQEDEEKKKEKKKKGKGYERPLRLEEHEEDVWRIPRDERSEEMKEKKNTLPSELKREISLRHRSIGLSIKAGDLSQAIHYLEIHLQFLLHLLNSSSLSSSLSSSSSFLSSSSLSSSPSSSRSFYTSVISPFLNSASGVVNLAGHLRDFSSALEVLFLLEKYDFLSPSLQHEDLGSSFIYTSALTGHIHYAKEMMDCMRRRGIPINRKAFDSVLRYYLKKKCYGYLSLKRKGLLDLMREEHFLLSPKQLLSLFLRDGELLYRQLEKERTLRRKLTKLLSSYLLYRREERANVRGEKRSLQSEREGGEQETKEEREKEREKEQEEEREREREEEMRRRIHELLCEVYREVHLSLRCLEMFHEVSQEILRSLDTSTKHVSPLSTREAAFLTRQFQRLAPYLSLLHLSRVISRYQQEEEGQSASSSLHSHPPFHTEKQGIDRISSSSSFSAPRYRFYGVCTGCGGHLHRVPLDEREKSLLRLGVLKLSSMLGLRQLRDLLSFERSLSRSYSRPLFSNQVRRHKKETSSSTLDSSTPISSCPSSPSFTIVLDGANIAYNGQNREDGSFSYLQIERVRRELLNRGERPLIILPSVYCWGVRTPGVSSPRHPNHPHSPAKRSSSSSSSFHSRRYRANSSFSSSSCSSSSSPELDHFPELDDGSLLAYRLSRQGDLLCREGLCIECEREVFIPNRSSRAGFLHSKKDKKDQAVRLQEDQKDQTHDFSPTTTSSSSSSPFCTSSSFSYARESRDSSFSSSSPLSEISSGLDHTGLSFQDRSRREEENEAKKKKRQDTCYPSSTSSSFLHSLKKPEYRRLTCLDRYLLNLWRKSRCLYVCDTGAHDDHYHLIASLTSPPLLLSPSSSSFSPFSSYVDPLSRHLENMQKATKKAEEPPRSSTSVNTSREGRHKEADEEKEILKDDLLSHHLHREEEAEEQVDRKQAEEEEEEIISEKRRSFFFFPLPLVTNDRFRDHRLSAQHRVSFRHWRDLSLLPYTFQWSDDKIPRGDPRGSRRRDRKRERLHEREEDMATSRRRTADLLSPFMENPEDHLLYTNEENCGGSYHSHEGETEEEDEKIRRINEFLYRNNRKALSHYDHPPYTDRASFSSPALFSHRCAKLSQLSKHQPSSSSSFFSSSSSFPLVCSSSDPPLLSVGMSRPVTHLMQASKKEIDLPTSKEMKRGETHSKDFPSLGPSSSSPPLLHACSSSPSSFHTGEKVREEREEDRERQGGGKRRRRPDGLDQDHGELSSSSSLSLSSSFFSSLSFLNGENRQTSIKPVIEKEEEEDESIDDSGGEFLHVRLLLQKYHEETKKMKEEKDEDTHTSLDKEKKEEDKTKKAVNKGDREIKWSSSSSPPPLENRKGTSSPLYPSSSSCRSSSSSSASVATSSFPLSSSSYYDVWHIPLEEEEEEERHRTLGLLLPPSSSSSLRDLPREKEKKKKCRDETPRICSGRSSTSRLSLLSDTSLIDTAEGVKNEREEEEDESYRGEEEEDEQEEEEQFYEERKKGRGEKREDEEPRGEGEDNRSDIWLGIDLSPLYKLMEERKHFLSSLSSFSSSS